MIRRSVRPEYIFSGWLLLSVSMAIAQTVNISFVVTPEPSEQLFRVSMSIDGYVGDSITLKMPVWTPGYYQILNFAENVSEFEAKASGGQKLPFVKSSENSWRIYKRGQTGLLVNYAVKATRPFVATCYVDKDRGYIMPAGVFMHIANLLGNPSTVQVKLPGEWKDIATGLPSGTGPGRFAAASFDILYDSPILMGNLESLTPFEVEGKTHRFIGYGLGDFDKKEFMKDLQKIVRISADIIDDVPYKEYTFIAIGPGQGGIEHLNSTSFGFNGSALNSEAGKFRLYTFLAHEYFHHYNVKRIRPIELGPFDYDRENRTKMLWVSEGLTVYYDLMIVRWAGLCTIDQLLGGLQSRLAGYENSPGKSFQSATEASYNTWDDGPFGRTDEEAYKTISVYDKGAILGLLLDFKIRHETKNEKSLDDVMRELYNTYYIKEKRGFTDDEFRTVCEEVAGVSLTEFFTYTFTTNPIDYKKYLGYAGLDIDMEPRKLDGAWVGIRARTRADSLRVLSVDYKSPAWKAGVRGGMVILDFNGDNNVSSLDPILTDVSHNVSLPLTIVNNGITSLYQILTEVKVEPTLKITPMKTQTELQKKIFDSWSGVKPSN